MKRILVLAGLMIMAVSCGVLSQSTPNQQAVDATVESGIYVTVNTILPSRGSSIHSSDGYFLKIKDGKASSYLPFIGTSDYAPMSIGSAQGIVLDNEPVDITESERKGFRIWEFTVRKSPEVQKFTLEFSGNGNANITVTSTVRSAMRYNCEVTEEPAKEE